MILISAQVNDGVYTRVAAMEESDGVEVTYNPGGGKINVAQYFISDTVTEL